MSTVGKEIADRLIAGGGWLLEHPDHDAPDNPQCVLIVEYTDQGGKLAYGATFMHETLGRQERYLTPSEYIRAPRVYWEISLGKAAPL